MVKSVTEVTPKSMAEIEPPQAILNVVVDQKGRELFMSFHLLNQLAKLAPQLDDIPMVTISPELREAVLLECLIERTDKGKRVSSNTPDLEDFDFSDDVALAILDWAADHLYFFTMKAMARMKEQEVRSKPASKLLTALLTGSPAKAS